MENKNGQNAAEDPRHKHDADSGNDDPNERLELEKLIDPGNEHSHDRADDSEKARHDADAGGDGTGTLGSKPE